MGVLDTIGRSLADGTGMFWQTLWALVLGFGLSGAVQAFVSRAEMQRALGDHRPLTIARAGFFGAIASSCSYAASPTRPAAQNILATDAVARYRVNRHRGTGTSVTSGTD
jgi:uncharacterized membrane protein YraQ (UPF0718 family)